MAYQSLSTNTPMAGNEHTDNSTHENNTVSNSIQNARVKYQLDRIHTIRAETSQDGLNKYKSRNKINNNVRSEEGLFWAGTNQFSVFSPKSKSIEPWILVTIFQHCTGGSNQNIKHERKF